MKSSKQTPSLAPGYQITSWKSICIKNRFQTQIKLWFTDHFPDVLLTFLLMWFPGSGAIFPSPTLGTGLFVHPSIHPRAGSRSPYCPWRRNRSGQCLSTSPQMESESREHTKMTHRVKRLIAHPLPRALSPTLGNESLHPVDGRKEPRVKDALSF